MKLFKAVNAAGFDFRTGTVNYLAPCVPLQGGDAFPGDGWYHLATTATGCNGIDWPFRLLVLEAQGEITSRFDYPFIIGVTAWEMVDELPAHEGFGPNGEEVIAIMNRASTITADEAAFFGGSRQDARDLPMVIGREAGKDLQGKYIEEVAWEHGAKPSRDLAYAVGWSNAFMATQQYGLPIAWGAARAASAMAESVMFRHLIPRAVYDYQTGPWREVFG